MNLTTKPLLADKSVSGRGEVATASVFILKGAYMRKFLLAAVLCLAGQTGCVHHGRPSKVATSPPPSSRPAPPRGYVPPPNQAPPATKAPAPGPAYTWMPKGRTINPKWTHVIIHHSATDSGSAQSFDRFHRGKGWDELGYHFVIGNGTQTPDGMIEVGARWHKQKHGAHCKTPDNYFNEHGIGICLVGDFTKTRPTRKQLTSLYHLSRFLSDSCGIPADRITTHCAVTNHTKCPGPGFPVQPLRDAVRASSRVASSQGPRSKAPQAR